MPVLNSNINIPVPKGSLIAEARVRRDFSTLGMAFDQARDEFHLEYGREPVLERCGFHGGWLDGEILFEIVELPES